MPPWAKDKRRTLLLDDLRARNATAERRWYNALTHNCTTTFWHRRETLGAGRPLEWRLLANGQLVDLAYGRRLGEPGPELVKNRRR